MSRKNAMLTTEDRRWLTGEKEYRGEHAKQQRYQRRRDIRERVHNSILDFSILFEHFEDAERRKLFRTDEGEQRVGADDEFAAGIRDGLAFLLHNTDITDSMNAGGAGENNVGEGDTVENDPGPPPSAAEWLLREAISEAGQKDGYLVENVDLDIRAQELPVSALLEDLRKGEELSPAGLRVLMEIEDVDTAELQEQLRTMIFENTDEQRGGESDV